MVPSIPEWIEDAKEALSNRRTSDMRPPELSSVLAKADATVGELPPERVKKKALKLSGAETGFMPARVHDSEATVQNPLAAEAPMEAPPVPERVMLLSTADDPDDNQAPADTPPAVELPPAAALPLPPQPAVAEEDPAKAKLLAVWARMDLDGSGTLDWGEVQQVMVAMGQDVDEIDMDAAMAEMDGDMSGEVSRECGSCLLCSAVCFWSRWLTNPLRSQWMSLKRGGTSRTQRPRSSCFSSKRFPLTERRR